MSERPPVIQTIVDQHAEEAAFLWLLRDAAVGAPHYSLKDLAELDERVEAHIDGLRVAGAAGWDTCAAALEADEPGEVFAAGVLAFEDQGGERIARVVQGGMSSTENTRALVSALGWIDFERLRPLAETMMNANAAAYRQLGLAAAAIHRVDPGPALDRALNDEDPGVRVRAIRAVGQLRRRDLAPALRRHFQSDDGEARFWSAWSGTLLGDREAGKMLVEHVNFPTPFRRTALDLVLRVLDCQAAGNWLKGLMQDPDNLRLVIEGTGIGGDPAYVPHLLRQMSAPEVARIAGEAFSMITGVDLAYDDLEGDWPEGFEAGPTEQPEDEDVAMDPDEDLPWPDPDLVEGWWQQNKGRFQPGIRFLCGEPITVDNCRRVLREGFQRQRHAAAIELALLSPAQQLFEVRAPGKLQQRLLAES